ncbi:hypothetical protein ACHAQJ_005492 [Trichoderma viride]
MKLPSTNYGIVTRFDMRTYHSSAIWGAVTVYPFTPTVASELYAQSEKWGLDSTNEANMVAVAMMRNKGTTVAMGVQANNDGIPQDPLTSHAPIMHLENIGSTFKVINDVIDSALAVTTRTRWYTITTKIDTDYFMAVFNNSKDIIKDVDNRENLLWNIPVFIALGQGEYDLVNIHIHVEWTNPDDDAALEEMANKLGTSAEAEAQKRNILNSFIYLNYADGKQPFYERSITPYDMERMIRVRKTYDPAGKFDQLWKGGYKLSKDGYRNTMANKISCEHDEL